MARTLQACGGVGRREESKGKANGAEEKVSSKFSVWQETYSIVYTMSVNKYRTLSSLLSFPSYGKWESFYPWKSGFLDVTFPRSNG